MLLTFSFSSRWAIVWPDSHHGPILDYLAPCNGNCETVDKTTLEWFKIDQVGYINGSNPGIWASDVLIADASTWLVQIPASLKPGNYVLRHEIIALHSAGSANGAQNYPQCFNLAVTGSGTLAPPSGTLGTALYSETDPGILYNLYTDVENYTIPGPTLYSGFSSSVAQSSSVATVTSSPIVPGATGASSSSSSRVTTTTAAVTTTAASSSTVQSTTITTSTIRSTTTSAPATTSPATTSAAGSGAGQTEYGQCGGSGWTGPTSCAQGACTTYNAYYAQCI